MLVDFATDSGTYHYKSHKLSTEIIFFSCKILEILQSGVFSCWNREKEPYLKTHECVALQRKVIG